MSARAFSSLSGYIENLSSLLPMDPGHDYYVYEAARPRVIRSIGRGVWTAVRFVLYMVLMLLRVPVQIVGHLLFLPLAGAGVFWGFVSGWRSPAFLWLMGVAVGLWVLSFLFDTLLLWVSPEELHLNT